MVSIMKSKCPRINSIVSLFHCLNHSKWKLRFKYIYAANAHYIIEEVKANQCIGRICYRTIIYTLLDRKDCTNALLWSKTRTTLTTGGVGGGAGVNPHP